MIGLFVETLKPWQLITGFTLKIIIEYETREQVATCKVGYALKRLLLLCIIGGEVVAHGITMMLEVSTVRALLMMGHSRKTTLETESVPPLVITQITAATCGVNVS